MSNELGRVAFIGLGVMGYPMAGHLAKQEASVTVYNRTGAKAQQWLEGHNDHGVCATAATPRQAAEAADVVLMCVGNDDDVRSVALGQDGALAGMSPGTVLVDHTTASQQLAVELASACKGAGVSFLDAPVSGGQAGAENAALTVMLGGSESDYQNIRPLLDIYAKNCLLYTSPSPRDS